MRRAIVGAVAAALVALAWSAAPAAARAPSCCVKHLHFHAGPYIVSPGANLILLQYNRVPKPSEDGYMIRVAPNLRYAKPNGKCCGTVPSVSVVHLHHGVWLSDGRAGQSEGLGAYGGLYPFMAVGEEKTIFEMPRGYGYPIAASDHWVLNYMIHDLTPRARKVYITYDMDFVPMTSPRAKRMTAVHPIWMDVRAGHIYPVFNVDRHSGRNGRFTYPDMARNPYGPPGVGPVLNQFRIDHPGTLIGTAGHLHPGGLWDQLDLLRPGAAPRHGARPGLVAGAVRLFRSYAHYFDKRGPISWNLAMTATPPTWRPRVRAGDTLRISTTYDTKRASWYEVMGIMVVWEAWNDRAGVDPFAHKLPQNGFLTHGYLPENNDTGGAFSLGINPNRFPTCRASQVDIRNFQFRPGDFAASGRQRCIPTVRQGQPLTFVNQDAYPAGRGSGFPYLSEPAWYVKSIFHSVTSCKDPCNRNGAISYPLANGFGFDSAQLGPALPASGSLSWSTPTGLKPGIYTYFCRIHPFMRGVFRVVG
jgi:hypothetical protein